MTDAPLPDAELEVLSCLWREKSLTARQIRETMSGYRPLSHSAVSTLLKRLEDKGLVRRRKSGLGKAFLFEPAVAPRKTYRRIVHDLVERVFGGDPLVLVSALFQGQPPTPEEIEQLQKLIDELRERQEPG